MDVDRYSKNITDKNKGKDLKKTSQNILIYKVKTSLLFCATFLPVKNILQFIYFHFIN